jgi:hypothetical protein
MPEDYDDDGSQAEEELEESDPDFDAPPIRSAPLSSWGQAFARIMNQAEAYRRDHRGNISTDDQEEFERGARIVLTSILGDDWDVDASARGAAYDVGGMMVVSFRSPLDGHINFALDYSTPRHTWKVFTEGYAGNFCSDTNELRDLLSITLANSIHRAVHTSISSGRRDGRVRSRIIRTNPSEASDSVFSADIRGGLDADL